MALIDRFGRQALVMAAIQVGLFALLLVHGLWPPSLGLHLVVPLLVLGGLQTILLWLTLTRPWSFSLGRGRSGPWLTRGPWFCEGRLILGMTLGIDAMYLRLLGQAKERLLAIQAYERAPWTWPAPPGAETWAADTFGASLVSGPAAIAAVALPLALLGILALFLPR